MADLRSLTASLIAQRRRYNYLVETLGVDDPTHPMLSFSIRRIAWLEERIAEEKEKRK